MRRTKTEVLPGESVAIHAKLDEILRGGDPAEVLLVIWLLLELRPLSRRKASKKERAARTAALKTSTRTGRASQAKLAYP